MKKLTMALAMTFALGTFAVSAVSLYSTHAVPVALHNDKDKEKEKKKSKCTKEDCTKKGKKKCCKSKASCSEKKDS